jgi:class 3 adenylate cyclase/tetratricopeptide (TPR) repeat protein
VSATAERRCSGCGKLTPAGKFCIHCGTPTQQGCPVCSAAVVPGAKFCLECGTALNGGVADAAAAFGAAGAIVVPVSERRLVSVLFADLVGFTTLSEHRDPEEVRDLLSRYFDRCRSLIERHGGIVEKFIGDAVMAVWGTPVAREDDAERSVRAALALTQAVTAMGAEVGMPSLRVRAGVLTGSAAVEVGAEGEGMVLGDAVNTASRLQSLAAPGTVLVDDVTRRASEAAIAYEDAGELFVKGREQPVHAWTALRVVAGAGGARRSAGLEAPFVGRDDELATIVDSFERAAADDRAGLVTVIGGAGVGKSRLLWEFFKYIDGVERIVRYHQGRCLSYGEGVAYWALAEIVRGRAGIDESEAAASARQKLRAVVEEFISDERERRLVEPRLAHLLGLEQRTATDRADLFSGWRLFFERIAAAEPVVLVFEDLQWADSGLLDFIDYLLEWSAEHPIFILALGRPEMLSARAAWTPTIVLEALGREAMLSMLEGLVPGLPETLGRKILDRAEGVPLYAVETVRMLLDRGVLHQEGNRYVVSGTITDLDVPETLQALVAARLDNLDPGERALLQDAAVIGQSFTPAMVAAVSDRSGQDVRRSLDALVTKQILAYVDDARSAERGQYSFLQGLLRTVALGTLGRRDRKAKHLAVARQLKQSGGVESGEIAEVLASHYLDAVEAEPDADDVAQIRALACETLEEAGQRAISLALGPEARRHFENAAKLAQEPAVKGRLLREAGNAAHRSNDFDSALALFEAASETLATAHLDRERAVVSGLIGTVLLEIGRADEAAERLARAYETLDDGSQDEAFAEVAAIRARVVFLTGDSEAALRFIDVALSIAEGLRLSRVLVDALTTKSIALAERGHPAESTALLTHATALAIEQDLGSHSIRSLYNLAENKMAEARFAEADELLQRALAIAHQRGDARGERWCLTQLMLVQIALGRWDEALSNSQAVWAAEQDDQWAYQALVFTPLVLVARGESARARELLGPLEVDTGWSESALIAAGARSTIQRDAGHPEVGLEEAIEATVAAAERVLSHGPVEFGEAVESAFAAGRPDAVERLLARIEGLAPVQLIPLLDAEALRARALLAAHHGKREDATRWFRRAIDLLREMETPFWLARAQLQYAEFIGDRDEAQAMRSEAAAVFERLGAAPWLARARGGSRSEVIA